MQIGVPKETWPGELRVALVPQNAKKLIALGVTITIESGAGVEAGCTDAAYEEAGVEIVKSAERGNWIRRCVIARAQTRTGRCWAAEIRCRQHQLLRPVQ